MSIYILSIDTTTEMCSAALMMGDKDLLLERSIYIYKMHAKHILSMIDSLLTEAMITVDKLHTLAFCYGPGSFTGIRISFGVIQGLALGVNIPIIGISTLKTLAEGAWRKTGVCQVMTAMDAKLGKVYWSIYKREKEIWFGQENEMLITPNFLRKINKNLHGKWTIAGNGWLIYPEMLSYFNKQQKIVYGKTIFPHAKDILPIAIHHYYNNEITPISLIQPNYLQNKII